MRIKTWLPLILALLLGLLAALAAKFMVRPGQDAGAPRSDFVEVVVARDNLPAGTTITLDDLTTGRVDHSFDSSNSFKDMAELDGRVAQAPLFKGLPVLSSQLAPKGAGGGLQALVPQGMRAITVEVNEISGVGGFLVPGCHVDIIATVPGEDGAVVSRTIVQRVKVTAVGQRMTLAGEDEQREPIRSVTLIATPKEAEAIELAGSVGRARLVLRSTGDQEMDESKGMTVAALRGNDKPPLLPIDLLPHNPVISEPVQPIVKNIDPFENAPVAIATPKVRTVKVIRGGVESEVWLRLPETQEQPRQQITGTSVEGVTH